MFAIRLALSGKVVKSGGKLKTFEDRNQAWEFIVNGKLRSKKATELMRKWGKVVEKSEVQA